MGADISSTGSDHRVQEVLQGGKRGLQSQERKDAGILVGRVKHAVAQTSDWMRPAAALG